MNQMANITYASLSEVPEDLREYAKTSDEGGDSYVVSVTAAAKIKEFRDNNIELSQQRDALTTAISQYERVTGVTMPDLEDGKLTEFASVLDGLRETKKKVDDGVLIEETSLEEASAARIAELTQNMKTQLADMAKDRDTHKASREAAEKKANEMYVENAVRLAASSADIAMIDKAISFVMPKALSTFRVGSDNSITPKSSDGTVIYGSDGVTPMSIKEWLQRERDENDFLFQNSKGGGASGNADTAPGRLSQAELDKMSPNARMQYARKHNLK